MLVFSAPLVNQRPSNLLNGSPTGLPPGYVFIQFVTGGGRGLGPQTDIHRPPSTFTGQFLRKADIQGLVSLQIFGPYVKLCKNIKNANGKILIKKMSVFSKGRRQHACTRKDPNIQHLKTSFFSTCKSAVLCKNLYLLRFPFSKKQSKRDPINMSCGCTEIKSKVLRNLQ